MQLDLVLSLCRRYFIVFRYNEFPESVFKSALVASLSVCLSLIIVAHLKIQMALTENILLKIQSMSTADQAGSMVAFKCISQSWV